MARIAEAGGVPVWNASNVDLGIHDAYRMHASAAAATIRSTSPAFPQATASNPCRRAIHGGLGTRTASSTGCCRRLVVTGVRIVSVPIGLPDVTTIVGAVPVDCLPLENLVFPVEGLVTQIRLWGFQFDGGVMMVLEWHGGGVEQGSNGTASTVPSDRD